MLELWDAYSKEQFQRVAKKMRAASTPWVTEGQDSWSEGANMDGNWERLGGIGLPTFTMTPSSKRLAPLSTIHTISGPGEPKM